MHLCDATAFNESEAARRRERFLFMCFLGAVYAAFVTLGARLGPHTKTGTHEHSIPRNTDGPARQSDIPDACFTLCFKPVAVNIIFTDLEATPAALKTGQSLAGVAVPFRLPIDRPQVSLDLLRETLRKLVWQVVQERFHPTIHLYVCRHRVRTLLQILKPDSLVIIGGRNHWWPTAERRIACAISSKGHRVVFVDSVPLATRRPRILVRPIFARVFISEWWLRFLFCFGVSPKPRSASRRLEMENAISGVVAVALFVYRWQGHLPLNPAHFSTSQAPQSATPMTPDLAFNTAVSFMTNTNWQAYSPETTVSYFVQMAALAVRPPLGVKLSCMPFTAPQLASVVTVANSADCAMPNRVSLP